MAGKALITEAGTPLGRALALHLAGRGYDVALHCTTAPEEAASTAAEARAIRRIRSRLASIAEQAPEKRKAPA